MRTNILPSELQVGQRVAVSRWGMWHATTQGVYIVAKANKLKVVLKRESDGYERTWSVKRNTEMPIHKGGYVDDSTFIESIEAMNARAAKMQKERERADAWANAEKAAKDKNLPALRRALAGIELLVQE
jgi:hypothetical protein